MRSDKQLICEAKGRTSEMGIDTDMAYGQLLRRMPPRADGLGTGTAAPEPVNWTLGRLILWSNDLLHTLVGAGFADQQHSAAFLWWAKDQPDERR